MVNPHNITCVQLGLQIALRASGQHEDLFSLFLQYIIIHAAVPPEVIDDIGVDGVITGEKLYKAPYKIRCLYVPTGSKEAYEKAQYWKYFKKILETDEV